MFNVEKFITDLHEYIGKALAPIVKRLEAVEKETLVITDEDILSALKSDPAMMRDVVADYLKVNPPASGPQGDPGPKGEKGDAGEKGEKGVDGVGATGAMLDKEGQLILTLGNGQLVRCGVVTGRDGKDLSDVEFEYDGGRTVAVKAKSGEVVRRYQMPIVIDKGYWRDGVIAEAGDGYTHDGNWWIAQQKTTARPSTQAKADWRLGARKGRDGRNGRDGKDAAVQLNKKDDGESNNND